MSKETKLLETLVEKAYKKINQLESDLNQTQQALIDQKADDRSMPSEPIAVIGMGCRFPGADTPEEYWQLLIEGRSSVRDMPPGRWDLDNFADQLLEGVTRASWSHSGYLDQNDQFDPLFFHISPREAMSMDTQQHLLLEVAWVALENAGISPDSLMDSSTGIFIGMMDGVDDFTDETRINNSMHSATGNASSLAAGRLSYVFGFQGPCLAIDTGCSAMMASAHLAVGSLRTGESDLALAGGVNIMTARGNVFMANIGLLAQDGRCKSFDVAADGHTRGEGCGIVVLKRLSDAERDGDKIWAVIRGSATNHDGRTSGLTVPKGPAQEDLIRRALKDGGIRPQEVSYSEAHATGTSLGDVIEIGALGAVYADRTEPLLTSSVKPNVGHLESASGATSLIKLVLALYHGELPPHIGMETPNPDIPWSQLPVEVVTQRRPWPQNPETDRRIGGASGFSHNGTNVHLVLEEPPAIHKAGTKGVKSKKDERDLHLFTLSAKNEKALQELADKYIAYIDTNPDVTLADFCFTSNVGRAQLVQRIGMIGTSIQEMRDRLAAFSAGKRKMGLFKGKSPSTRPKVAFLFSGLGGQAKDMGRRLYETAPIYRAAIDRCSQLLGEDLDKPLVEILYGGPEGPSDLLSQTAYAEPALFAVEYALAMLWQSWGITPDVVLGHSLGEYVAACIAGVVRLEDALKLVVQRGKLVESASGEGATASILAPSASVMNLVAPFEGQVSIAGINSPEEVLIAGQIGAVEEVLALVREAGFDGKRLNVAHAAHSPLMDPVLDTFTNVAESITYRRPRIKFISSVTGEFCRSVDANHWRNHLREPVRFADSIATLATTECVSMVEIGPEPTLTWLGRQNWTSERDVQWLPSLWSLHDDWKQIWQSLAELYVKGATVNWKQVYQGYDYQKVILPNYAFQRTNIRNPHARPIKTAAPAEETQIESPPLEPAPVLSEQDAPAENIASSYVGLLTELASATPSEREQKILTFIQEQVAIILYMDIDEVQPDSNLVEFGMDSVMAMNILSACREVLGFVLYPRDLYERPILSKFASYLADEYGHLQDGNTSHTTTEFVTTIDREFSIPEQKNPPMLFVLSAPRSGSTLFRVMLAGHPMLFAPPELHLLWMAQMSEFAELEYLGEGLQRTLMALDGVDAETSWATIEQWIAENRSIADIYGLLQKRSSPRMLVDKSPTYGNDLNVLHRIEQLFDQPKYIHLVRHPYAMIESHIRNRMDRTSGGTARDSFSIAEQVWINSNQNIETTLADIDSRRTHMLRYEDLVHNPEEQMQRVAQFLDIEYTDAMVTPYTGERITDGVHANSIPLGDMNFASHERLRPELADVWRDIDLPRPLHEDAVRMAIHFGYELPNENKDNLPLSKSVGSKSVGSKPAQAPLMKEHLLDVRDSTLCVCEWSHDTKIENKGSTIVCIHGLLDHGASWGDVAETLAVEGHRVIAPDLRGHGRSAHVAPNDGYQLIDFVSDLDALFNDQTLELGTEPVTLIGHSMGAMVAAFYAAARPERVKQLYMIESYVPMEHQTQSLVDQLVTQLDYRTMNLQHPIFPSVDIAADHLRQTMPALSESAARRAAERLTKPNELSDKQGVVWRWDVRLSTRSMNLSLQDATGQQSYLSLFEQIQAPITMVYGQDSSFHRQQAKDILTKMYPNITQVTFSGTHHLHIEKPEELSRVFAENSAFG